MATARKRSVPRTTPMLRRLSCWNLFQRSASEKIRSAIMRLCTGSVGS
jgi:hypothetical protein